MDRRAGDPDGGRCAAQRPRAESDHRSAGPAGSLSRAPIFARVSGYLKGWSADIGAKVKAGDVIAEIEAPDLDQQLLQAKADLISQQSSAQLSEATLNRRKTLLASNFVSMRRSTSAPPTSTTRRPP
jgi:multidrug efflux pump subunit AcrA (membrane-fusion protein)